MNLMILVYPNKDMVTPPKTFIKVNETIHLNGEKYQAILRPKDYLPADVCKGYDLREDGQNCKIMQCSSFDRRDNKSVWFVRV